MSTDDSSLETATSSLLPNQIPRSRGRAIPRSESSFERETGYVSVSGRKWKVVDYNSSVHRNSLDHMNDLKRSRLIVWNLRSTHSVRSLKTKILDERTWVNIESPTVEEGDTWCT